MKTDWSNVFKGLEATLAYEDATFGVVEPSSDADLALIELPGDHHVEVTWNDESGCYVSSLYEQGFNSLLEDRRHTSTMTR